MEPPEKRKRGLWTESQLKAAIQSVRNHQMSQRKAAAVYSIPRRTLRNHLKSGSNKKTTGRLPILSKAQEKELTNRIIRLAQVGIPLTPRLVRKQAYEFCKSNEIPNSFNDKKNTAGKKWLKGFINRNPEVTIRKAQFMNPARAQKLNKPIVLKHFEAVKNIYDELDISSHPERLYNMDEKGCRLTIHHQQKVLAEKGTKRVHFVAQEHAENVTIAMCVNATGNSVPPMILFKGKRMKPEYYDNFPSGTLVKMAPKGSMTTELFVDFINHLGKYKSPGRCLLIFDGASSHLDARIVDEADKYNIVLYCLPSNTTHELQPLDKSVNKSFEHHWDEEVLVYAYEHPERKITKSRFGKIFTKVWSKCMTHGNIINGFRSTGLYPFNPTAIPDEAYAPSVLTQIPDPQNVPKIHDFTSTLSRCHNDSDATDYEDNFQNMSPSILHQNDELIVNEKCLEQITQDIPVALMHEDLKLVDYSSSSESTIEVLPYCRSPSKELININPGFHSPIPSSSGINKQFRTPINSSLSDSSLSEDVDTVLQKHFQNLAKKTNIYTSSSETEEENGRENTSTLPRKKDDNNFGSDDSDDNVPLSSTKEAAGISGTNVRNTFHKQIPTPNFAIIKSTPRRKALNYIGQKITKDLFDIAKDKKNTKETKKSKKDTVLLHKRDGKPEKRKNKQDNPEKEVKARQIKDKKMKNNSSAEKPKKAQNKDQRHQIKGKRSKNTVNIDTKRSKNESWFCQACNVERIADMRQCEECRAWYHEECVGLTKEDEEQFVCPECT